MPESVYDRLAAAADPAACNLDGEHEEGDVLLAPGLVDHLATSDAGADGVARFLREERPLTPADVDAVMAQCHAEHVLEALAIGESDPDASEWQAHARRMMRECAGVEAVKLGIGLCATLGDASDLATLDVLARHDAFTARCIGALIHLDADPLPRLRAWASALRGWGRVVAVRAFCAVGEQAGGLDADARAWLIREGYSGYIPGELAVCCAVAGQLDAQLDGPVDDALLDAACDLLRALLDEDAPSDAMAAYPHGFAATERCLSLVEVRPTLGRCRFAAACADFTRQYFGPEIRDWAKDARHDLEQAGWAERDAIALGERSLAVLARFESESRAQFETGARPERHRAWRLARTAGWDLRPAAQARLVADPLGEECEDLWMYLCEHPSRAQGRWLVDYAHEVLDLGRVASGPTAHVFARDTGEWALLWLVQAMLHERVPADETLLVAGLSHPVTSVRVQACRVLEREGLTPAAREALRAAHAREPRARVAQMMAELLAD